MVELDKASQTQLNNIQARTGKTFDEIVATIQASGLEKHSDILNFLKEKYALGYGDANMLALLHRRSLAPAATDADPLDAIYTGSKTGLRPLHEQVISAIDRFGAYEQSPKKAYISLRRKKQFAIVGPGTKGRLEIGLNMRDVPATERLQLEPEGSMCQYKVHLTNAGEVDAELLGWLKRAYDAAG